MLKSTRTSADAVRPAKQLRGGCATLFGLPFIIAGLAIGWFLYLPAVSTWWAARGWEEVPCWIERTEMKHSSSSEGGATQRTEATYRYQYLGRTYHSEEVGLTGGSDNIGDFQERAYHELRSFAGRDKPFRCYVNPGKPEQAVLYRELRWGLMLLMSLFPMVFPLAGFLVSLAGGREARGAALARRLEARHPGAPWRWRSEWAGDSIRASSDGLAAYLGVAGWILLIQIPIALAIVHSGTLVRSPISALGLLPVLLAWFPFSAAWSRWKTRRAFGHPALRLAQWPVSPGRLLDGELHFDRVLSPREVIQARLLCRRQITRRSGDSRTTVQEVVWEHGELLAAGEARRELKGVALPLRVEIPPGLPCSVVEDTAVITGENESHVWSLEITPGNGGRPVVLPLPVFVTGKEAEVTDSDTGYDIKALAPDTDQLVARLKMRGVDAEFDAAGVPTLFDCPPGRFRGMAFFLLGFGCIWFAAFVFMVKQGAPFIFRFLWGLTSPMIIAGGVWTLLYRRRVEISADELRIVSSIGPFYSWKESCAPRHIVSFAHDSNMQAGNQFYYRVIAETTFGKKKTVIDGITESVTAEALAERMERWRDAK